MGNVGDVLLSLDPEYFRVPRIHQKYFFWKLTFQEISSNGTPNGAMPVGCPDDRDGARKEQSFQAGARGSLLSKQY